MFHYKFLKLFRFKVYFKKILPAPRGGHKRRGFGGARARCDRPVPPHTLVHLIRKQLSICVSILNVFQNSRRIENFLG